jgi:hypothetical protein
VRQAPDREPVRRPTGVTPEDTAYRTLPGDTPEQLLTRLTSEIGQVIEETLTWDIAYRTMLKRQFQAMGFTFDTP